MENIFASGRVVDVEQGSGAVDSGNTALIVIALVAAAIGIVVIILMRRGVLGKKGMGGRGKQAKKMAAGGSLPKAATPNVSRVSRMQKTSMKAQKPARKSIAKPNKKKLGRKK